MSIRKRVPAVAGGLGAVVLLGLAANFAIGGQHYNGPSHHSPKSAKANNVILFLGDGMGVSEVTAARYYHYGADGRMAMDKLPFTGYQTTWSLKPGFAPYKVDYDPDSASTATMWATGEKTIDERLSQGPSSAENVPGENFETVLEIARKAGKKTGNVSTAEITDATPAALDSHISLRGCQGPNDARNTCPLETKAAGGLGSIAEQTIDHKVDVVLGGGRARFEQPLAAGGSTNVVDYAKAKGYQYVTDAAGLEGVKSGKPVLGLFTPVNMTTEWIGPIAKLGDPAAPAKCTETNRPATEPSLVAMTKKALSLLPGDKDGFFLQVEGASIDKQDHAANACAQIGETVAFDQAIAAGLDYQRKHPDTLVLVTADHSHTSQIVAEDTTGNGSTTGYSTDLTTVDGQTLRIAYATAGGTARPAAPPSQQHTGAAVPIMGIGPGRLGDPRDHRPHRPVPAPAGRRPAPRALGERTGRPA
jgi:alkaline phosphatase